MDGLSFELAQVTECAEALEDVRAFGSVLPAAARQVSASVLRARRLSPELKRLPTKYVHKPWAAPAAVLRDAGVSFGRPASGTPRKGT